MNTTSPRGNTAAEGGMSEVKAPYSAPRRSTASRRSYCAWCGKPTKTPFCSGECFVIGVSYVRNRHITEELRQLRQDHQQNRMDNIALADPTVAAGRRMRVEPIPAAELAPERSE